MTDSTPMPLLKAVVLPDWIDQNGHMNVAFYAALFDKALDAFLDIAGVGRDYADQQNCAMFVAECHFTYQREVTMGDPIVARGQLLDRDRKRIHLFLELYHETGQFLVATSEQIAIHVDLATRKSLSISAPVMDRLSEILDAHQKIARPKEVGHKISMRRKKLHPAPS